jgi:DNA polymerase III delta subunit
VISQRLFFFGNFVDFRSFPVTIHSFRMFYYCFGADWMRARLFVDELRQTTAAGLRNISLVLPDNADQVSALIEELSRAQQLFGSGVCAVIRSDKFTKDQQKLLAPLMKLAPASDSILVAWESANVPSFKLARTKGREVHAFKELSARAFESWAEEYLRAQGIKLPAGVRRALVELTVPRTDWFVQEADKLRIAAAGGFLPEATAALTGAPADFFSQIADMFSGTARSIKEGLPDTQDGLMRFLATILNGARIAVVERRAPGQAAKVLGANPYWVQRMAANTGTLSDVRLVRLFKALLDVDLRVRSGTISFEEARGTLLQILIG